MHKLALLAALVGCGGLSSDLEGIYEIGTWTQNPDACDVEGPSILEQQSQTLFYVRVENFLGQKFLNASLCDDLANCQSEAGSDTINLNGWAFDGGDDSNGWTGATVFAGGSGTECTGQVTDHLMTSSGPDTVLIESRTRETLPFPVDSDGFCDTDQARAAAEGQPCITFEVVTATRTANL